MLNFEFERWLAQVGLSVSGDHSDDVLHWEHTVRSGVHLACGRREIPPENHRFVQFGTVAEASELESMP